MFLKKVVLKNFEKFIGVCGSLFFNRPASFLKREAQVQLYSSEFCKIFKNIFFTEYLQATASEYRNNMPAVFKTKYEKNDSDDIPITYLYILMASTYLRLNYSNT